MREYVTLANVITSCSLVAGFSALVAVHSNRLFVAAALIAVAGVLDSVDGPIARRGARNGAFGTNLDSLADMVSFGIAPPLALYLGLLQGWPVVGLIVCLGFVVCGAWRLARFPLIKDPHRFTGVPLPPAGVLLAWVAALGPPPLVAVLVTPVLSALMVSSVPFPTISALLGNATSIPHHLVNRRSSRK